MTDIGPGEGDPRPAVRLRRELERDRAMGHSFDEVWAEDVELVVRGYPLTKQDRQQWLIAFSDSEPAWRAAYERSAAACALTVELLAD